MANVILLWLSFSEIRIQFHIIEEIMHPAHVPFVAEIQGRRLPAGPVTIGHAVDSSAIIMRAVVSACDQLC